MAASFAVTISAKDSASGTIDSINKRMAAFNTQVARTRAPFDGLVKNYEKFTKVTGVDKIAGGLQSVGRAGFSAFQSVTRIVEPLGVIVGSASLAGMYKLAVSWANFGSTLGNVAARAGLTATQMHTLENAGRLAGVSAEAMATGMTTLRDNMVNAVGGKAPQVVAMIQALGGSMADVKRYAADTTKALPELADKIAGLKDPTLQAEAATALFGGAGEQLLPFLKKGAAGIAEYTEKAARYGTINAEGVKAANDLRMAQAGLTMAVEGLGYAVSERLGPVLGPLLTQMADWIARNRDWIAQGIGEKVQQFADFLKNVDWTGIGASISAFAHTADSVASAFGGWVPVIETIIGLKLLGWVTGLLGPLASLIKLLAVIPGSGVAAAAAAVAVGGVLGFKGAEASGTEIGRAAEMGLRVGGMDEWGNATHYLDQTGRRVMPGEVGRLQGAPAFGPRPDAPSGPRPPAPGGGSPANQAQWNTDLQQLMGKGWTKEQAAGVLGNLDQESGGNHLISGDGGRAFGLAQWHEDRQANFAKAMGHDIRQSTHAEQIDFVNWELNNTERAAGDRLRTARTARQSAAILRQGYERPADAFGQEDNWRGSRAERILAQSTPSGPDRSLPANAGTAANPGGMSPNDISGKIDTSIRFANAPAGMQVSTTQTGASLAPMKVERSLVGGGP